MEGKQISVWVHDDAFSKEEVLVALSVFGEENLPPNALMEIVLLRPALLNNERHQPGFSIRKAGKSEDESIPSTYEIPGHNHLDSTSRDHGYRVYGQNGTFEVDPKTRYCFVAKPMPSEIQTSHPTIQVSIHSSVALTLGYQKRAPALISVVDEHDCSASHVELVFRDEYLSRSDMWRLVSSEMVGKTVYRGQKFTFLGSIKAVAKTVVVNGHQSSSAYFCDTTIPIFRSESARFVIFIQMSREMWDFDSEGTGEILFSRVMHGFLPELFKKWVSLEARHLVTIVLFSRVEYDRPGLVPRLPSDTTEVGELSISDHTVKHQDFYRVVVTDMASGQWTTILDELRKDFRVFLRDITLYQPTEQSFLEGHSEGNDLKDRKTRISGHPTSAIRGNILEAINTASFQFANDHIDRDLVRTGISIIVITPGTGIFEVDRHLLELTSENLTNNGIGIDLVCMSKVPLHSVPLFKWRENGSKIKTDKELERLASNEKGPSVTDYSNTETSSLQTLPAYNSLSESTLQTRRLKQISETGFSFGVPQWVDVSYWTPRRDGRQQNHHDQKSHALTHYHLSEKRGRQFIPRVRMYELQMMGVMELGLANISIPYLSERHLTISAENNNRKAGPKGQRQELSRQDRYAFSPRSPLSPHSINSANSLRKRRGLLSVHARLQGDMYERMDEYDNSLFTLNARHELKAVRSAEIIDRDSPDADTQEHRNSLHVTNIRSTTNSETTDSDLANPDENVKTLKTQRSGLLTKSMKDRSRPDPRISRNISFALRGLGPSTPRAVASTEVNVENVQASKTKVKSPVEDAPASSSEKSKSQSIPKPDSRNAIDHKISDSSMSEKPQQAPKSSVSRPIAIKDSAKKDKSYNLGYQNAHGQSPRSSSYRPKGGRSRSYRSSESPMDGSVPASLNSSQHSSSWIKNVNPAKPSKNLSKAAHWTGRWQHLYPYAPKTSTVRWKSFCIPASVPLTTEEFPDKTDWHTHYQQSSYIVSLINDVELAEVPTTREQLLQEMICLRLSHGYQFVIGDHVAEVIGAEIPASASCFVIGRLSKDGAQVYMSMGNTIQRLVCLSKTSIQITRFVRKLPPGLEDGKSLISYQPIIRTILSKSYIPRPMTLEGFSPSYAWNLADHHIAGQKEDELADLGDQLRLWRARYVVIPITVPTSDRRPAQSSSDDNEEEIHLLGIRELTKMWQKARYTRPEERRFKTTSDRKKDPNPLEIAFQTLNPSEVVATESEKLLANNEGEEHKPTQLLPDSELLERSTSSVSKIAQVLQGEKGVEIRNRKWHLLLHDPCFKGDDLTNWLIASFKDIDSRDEAVDFGNELMDHGLFTHVSKRHQFKDGNYFYRITDKLRADRPDSRSSWFSGNRRSEKSVPATPINGDNTFSSPLSNHQEASTTSLRPTESRSSDKTIHEKRQVAVSLTKLMHIDVDHRSLKRSDRPEVANLHYDRLHNPENCYHFELSWFNATSKLVEDALSNWATQVERYGLRILEVPIAEASDVNEREPFRASYKIVLKVTPPPVPTGKIISHYPSTSFAPQHTPSHHKLFYQKALLRRFNFVLDLEAASDFPADVDVTYTWGKLGYRYPQFIHRSGVITAQITDEGDFLLLGNRLYDTRSSPIGKEAANKSESKHGRAYHRPFAASGIIGLNVKNPSPYPSPLVQPHTEIRSSSGNGKNTTGTDPSSSQDTTAYITPEQIKDSLETFCTDAESLRAFYQEMSDRTPSTTTAALSRKSGSSSSSVLRPVAEHGLENVIPDLRLPASLTAAGIPGLKSLGLVGAGWGRRVSPGSNSNLKADGGRDADGSEGGAGGGGSGSDNFSGEAK